MMPALQPRFGDFSSGFTLLELCIVLFIMMLLAGVATPAVHSALVERALRNDENQTGQLVKNAMRFTSEQRQSCMLVLSGHTLVLTTDQPGPSAGPLASATLAHDLELPRADKPGSWDAAPSMRWTFMPAGLCPLPRLRLQEGSAYVEMDFNALTGNVENEAVYLP